eukprot:Nitzschia sp. Nitz4//scaffold213_size37731//29353//31346//NITZ4_007725-RA/size37731-snap-gene-0.56-mRNA-1//1//CDS//3329542080//1627//frame0
MMAAFKLSFLIGLLIFQVSPSFTDGEVLNIIDYGAKADKVTVQVYWNLPSSTGYGSDIIDDEEQKEESYRGHHPHQDVQLAQQNSAAFNATIQAAQPGDTILIPEDLSFLMIGGIVARDKENITIDFAGAIHFVNIRTEWPITFYLKSDKTEGSYYDPCILIYNCTNVVLTSSSLHRPEVVVDLKDDKRPVQIDLSSSEKSTAIGGLIYGNGQRWWVSKDLGEMNHSCARLIQILESANMLVENLTLLNSPYWTLTIQAIDSEIRHVNVLVDRFYALNTWRENVADAVDDLVLPWIEAKLDKILNRTGILSSELGNEVVEYLEKVLLWIIGKVSQIMELNTDGIDPSGRNIWIHDCIIQNEDDSIGVKPMSGGRQDSRIPDCTTDITIENMVLTGIGASIGSVPGSVHHNCVDGVTFRNISMPGTGKGIYVKSDWGSENCNDNASGQITNILYEDIEIYKPWWWALWIGPQQIHEPGSGLKNACALTWPINDKCPVAGCVEISDITLRNVHIEKPLLPPYIIRGNSTDNPIRNLRVEHLTVNENIFGEIAWKALWAALRESFCLHATGTYDRSTNVNFSCLEKTRRKQVNPDDLAGSIADEL